jgi:hypothetical protein
VSSGGKPADSRHDEQPCDACAPAGRFGDVD